MLRVGENTSYLHERVVAEFEKQRSLDEIAAFLPTVYHGGVGVVVDGERYAAWMSTDGIRIAQGNAARYERDVHLVTWGDASRRIDELLDAGSTRVSGSWSAAPRRSANCWHSRWFTSTVTSRMGRTATFSPALTA